MQVVGGVCKSLLKKKKKGAALGGVEEQTRDKV